MSTVSVARVIAAPAGELYAMVSDLPRMGEWSPENTGGVWINGATGPAVGARFRGTNRNGRNNWVTTAHVEVADPGREFTFRITVGPFKVARWSYRFEPVGEPDAASTRVTETWTDQRGRLATLAGGRVSGVADRAAHNKASMEATLAALDHAVSSQ